MTSSLQDLETPTRGCGRREGARSLSTALLLGLALAAIAWPATKAMAAAWTTFWSPPTWASAGLAKTDAVWNNKIEELSTVAPCNQLWRMWEVGSDGNRYHDFSATTCGTLDVAHGSEYHVAYCSAVGGGTSNLLCRYQHT